MFVFTLIDNMDMEQVVPFYYQTKRLDINDCINFIFKDKDVYKNFKMMRLKTNIHLHEKLIENFLEDTLIHPQQILFIDVKESLIKNPIPLFRDALTRSEVVFYESKYNYKFFGANYNNNFRFYYPGLMDDYEVYLQKNEGNIYTLPPCGLTTTKLV